MASNAAEQLKRADPPVTCSEHPDEALKVGYDAWAPVDVRDRLMRCPRPDSEHAPIPGPYRVDRQSSRRCAQCGGPIGGRREYRAVYCGTTCRVAAHRAEKRRAAASA